MLTLKLLFWSLGKKPNHKKIIITFVVFRIFATFAAKIYKTVINYGLQ